MDLLSQLVEDEDVDVRYSIAEDSQAPPAILRRLSNDENPYISFRAQQTLQRLQQTATALQAA